MGGDAEVGLDKPSAWVLVGGMVTDPDINKRLAAVEKRLTAVERAVDKPIAAAAAKLGSMSRVNPTEKQIAASRLNGAKSKAKEKLQAPAMNKALHPAEFENTELGDEG